jgi:hypothetical protein
MFDQAVEASEAMRQCRGTLIPALCGCKGCDAVRMIASPAPSVCTTCGSAMTVLTAPEIHAAAELAHNRSEARDAVRPCAA